MLSALRTIGDWDQFIAAFTTKRQTVRERITQLREQKQSLALEAAIGSEAAKKQLVKVDSELQRLNAESENGELAIAQAESEKQKAAKDAAANAELKRKATIAKHMDRYFSHVQRIDAQIAEMAAECKAAWQELRDCEGIMTDAERTPIHQLHGRAPLTFAAAFHGLGAFIELGPSMAQYRHRQPLAKFAGPFVNRWVAGEED